MKKYTEKQLRELEAYKYLAKTNATLYATEDGQFFTKDSKNYAESHAGTVKCLVIELNTGAKASDMEKAHDEEEKKKLMGLYSQLTNKQVPSNIKLSDLQKKIEKVQADIIDGNDVRELKTSDQIAKEKFLAQYKTITGKALDAKGLSLANIEHAVMEATKKAGEKAKKEGTAKTDKQQEEADKQAAADRKEAIDKLAKLKPDVEIADKTPLKEILAHIENAELEAEEGNDDVDKNEDKK